MYTVKGDYYVSDNVTHPFGKKFDTLDDFFNFLSDYVHGDYTIGKSPSIHLGTHYANLKEEEVTETTIISEIQAGSINIEGAILRVFEISNEEGIIFSNERYTAGIRHASEGYKEWAREKTQKFLKGSKDFKFVPW